MMKISISELRHIIREATDAAELRAELTARSKSKPFLRGQWKREPSTRGSDDVYTASDESGRDFKLGISSDTIYKLDGRIRDVGGTQFVWKATMLVDPREQWRDVVFVHVKVKGESKQRDGQNAFRAKVMKIFGFDPIPWGGPLNSDSP